MDQPDQPGTDALRAEISDRLAKIETKIDALLEKRSMRRDFFPRVYLWIARVSPLYYAIIYVGVLLLFTGIYAFLLKDGFYAPYTHFEKPFLDAKEDLAKYLEQAVMDEIARKANEESKSKDREMQRYFDERSPWQLYNLNIGDNNNISFEMLSQVVLSNEIFSDYGDTHDTYNFYCQFRFDTSTLSSWRFASQVSQYHIAKVFYVPTDECKKETMERLFFQASGDSFGLPILVAKSREAKSLTEGLTGIPSSVEGNLLRMLYLSIVVITTLGLGDIVPISPLARGFVGGEAFSGVVLIGLFLNAVAWRASNPNPDGNGRTSTTLTNDKTVTDRSGATVTVGAATETIGESGTASVASNATGTST
jgi:hypothetical protein